jgi:hypothetical protein
MKQIMFSFLILVTLFSCEKENPCCVTIDEPIQTIQKCPATDVKQMIADLDNPPQGIPITKVVVFPLVEDPTCEYYVDGVVEYFFDGHPYIIIDYANPEGMALKTTYVVYNEGAPCESEVEYCVFDQECVTDQATDK